jgi:hypothetical protein
MNRTILLDRAFGALGLGALLLAGGSLPAEEAATSRRYENRLEPLADPRPLLADHPRFVAPLEESARFAAPALVDDEGADLEVRAWRFSYNARGIIEMPNRLRASQTAVLVVHPWGVDDGQGWRSPEPAGVAFFCTPEKNRLSLEHAAEVIDPFLKSLRGKVGLVAYSLPGLEDPVRKKLYRSRHGRPAAAEQRQGAQELALKLRSFPYRGEPLPPVLALSADQPVADYFRQFPGLDSGAAFNHAGFWDLPIPVVRQIEVAADDVVFYDSEGYEPLAAFLREQGIRHVLLAGYATDMCYASTTAGYRNLSQDFNVFLVGDATLATFPASKSPATATTAALAFASLDQLITQVSWVKVKR